jgi:16S rRNA (uracil1498-N3)-methyltransferase
MTDPVFHLDRAALVAADQLVLTGAEGHHAADVRRLQVGEVLVVTDGEGTASRCRVTAVRRGELDLVVEHRWAEPEPYPRLTVVQALAKGDRSGTAVETLTEVGVDVIVPWAAERSVTRWAPDRVDKALARWQATAREAAKQARRIRWPEVRPQADTAAVAGLLSRSDLALVLHESAERALASLDVPTADGVLIVLVVGPEGGIAPDELETFSRAGALSVRLGPSVLRTSTAGTAAAAALLARTPRWA